jgi:hypothetical protein
MLMTDEIENFEELKEFLLTHPHPEIHHLRNLCHPGLHFWLKTVCPDPRLISLDKEKWGFIWSENAEKYSNLIQLVDVAFDWHGNKIPYTWSIWLHKSVDALMFIEGQILLVEKAIGSYNMSLEINKLDIDWATKAADTILLPFANDLADLRRKNFKIMQSK